MYHVQVSSPSVSLSTFYFHHTLSAQIHTGGPPPAKGLPSHRRTPPRGRTTTPREDPHPTGGLLPRGRPSTPWEDSRLQEDPHPTGGPPPARTPTPREDHRPREDSHPTGGLPPDPAGPVHIPWAGRDHLPPVPVCNAVDGCQPPGLREHPSTHSPWRGRWQRRELLGGPQGGQAGAGHGSRVRLLCAHPPPHTQAAGRASGALSVRQGSSAPSRVEQEAGCRP